MQRTAMSWVVVLLSGLLASCAAAVWPPLAAVPDAERSPACGPSRFPVSLLDGPMLSREEFLDTEAGQVIGEFFTVGVGRFIEGWREAEGFSLVSEYFVLFYRDGLPAWHWHIDDRDRVGGGGCLPEWTLGELTAADWSLTAPIDENDRLIIIEVRVPSCDSEFRGELAGVELIETTETIEITAWIRGWGEERACIGGRAVDHPAVVVLGSSLGARTVLDAGVIPGQEITFSEE